MADVEKKMVHTLPIGTVLHGKNNYRIESVLGQGGFGITYKVTADQFINRIPVRITYAVKEHFVRDCCKRAEDGITMVFDPEKANEVAESRACFENEAKRLVDICEANGKHVDLGRMNIVPVNEFFEDNQTAYFVMEYLDGGSLRDYVEQGGPLNEDQMLALMKPICEATEYLHSNRLLHMDIKPENVVMRCGESGEPETPMLIDFGIAVHFNKKGNLTSRSITGFVTPGYSPIEQSYEVRGFDPRYDVYALAATMLFLLSGKDPQNAADINRDKILEAIPAEVSDRTRNAILHAMQFNKLDRTPTAKQLLQELETGKVQSAQDVLVQLNRNTTHRTRNIAEVKEGSGKNYMKFVWPLIGLVMLGSLGTIIFKTCDKSSNNEATVSVVVQDSTTVQEADSLGNLPVKQSPPTSTSKEEAPSTNEQDKKSPAAQQQEKPVVNQTHPTAAKSDNAAQQQSSATAEKAATPAKESSSASSADAKVLKMLKSLKAKGNPTPQELNQLNQAKAKASAAVQHEVDIYLSDMGF